MTRIQQTRLVVSIIIGLLVGANLGYDARADTAVFEEPSATRTSSDQTRWTYPTEHKYQGCLATLEIAETNEGQPSEHTTLPYNQFVVAIDGVEIARMDIETGIGGASVRFVTAVMGEELSAWYELGGDGVTSSGFAVAVTCEDAPPDTTTTTVPPPDTTTTTTTDAPPDTTTTTTVPTVPPVIQPTTTTTVAPTPPATTATTEAPIPSGVPTGSGPPDDPPRRSMTPAIGIIALGVVFYGIAWTVRKVRAR